MYIFARIINKLKPTAIKNSFVASSAKVESGSQFIDSKMDKYSFCGYDCVIINTEIGAFCSIASNVKIGLLGHPLEWISTSCAFYKGRDSIKKNFASLNYEQPNKRTIIGNDVWIGENVLVKNGVKIGNGSVIGMGSVLLKDVGDYEIWAGNPAKLIRKRFDDETINKLQSIQWWDYNDKLLEKYSNKMNDVNNFIASIGKERK